MLNKILSTFSPLATASPSRYELRVVNCEVEDTRSKFPASLLATRNSNLATCPSFIIPWPEALEGIISATCPNVGHLVGQSVSFLGHQNGQKPHFQPENADSIPHEKN